MKFFKKIFRKLFYKFFPELKKASNNIEKIQGEVFYNSNKGENVKTMYPFLIVNSKIGNYSYVNQNSIITNTSIGKFCSIGRNVVCGNGIHPINGISTHPMFYSTRKQNGITLSEIDKIEERKRITIGNDVFIGANVTILDGVTIGDGAVIGAGAVVSKDIPSYAVAIGCPIEVVRYRFDIDIIKQLNEIKWWDFEKEDLKFLEKNFFDVNAIISNFYNK